ncbi:type II toxin-antitoxin system RelE/ParE family toxin [Duganella sp. FT27W]|uniref:type II toxin-antitoxin system RelE/ParE family toxin n=1 Tax=Duganella sp. FT27W TaxID=2654636 RepID=UPI00128AE70E|nr:type II toxin-antitoxin system RelE/ParE family toxin [Duganella sp. FT27W]MPQ58852.1 hypothetical protein [Duganella sp. FT27W]
MNYDIQYYLNSNAVNVAGKWLRSLRDPIAKAKITKRISRFEHGNFGDHKPCREGVWEMRVDEGPGYRVYYAFSGRQIILLLCGGDKTTQDADINTAVSYGKIGKKGNKMTTKNRSSQPHDEVVADMLQADPAFRAALINEVMNDGEYGDMLILLRQLTLAEGGMKIIAQRTGLNETALYRLMSAEGNPSLKNFSKVLSALNLQLAVTAKHGGVAA